MVEQRFRLRIDDILIIGVFDRVERHNKDFEIIEYKTTRTMMAEEEAREDLQLGLYQFAFKNIVGRLPKYLSFYFLRQNKKITITRDQQGLKKFINIIGQVVTGIKKGEFKPKQGKLCKTCGFKEYCPLKTKGPKKVKDSAYQLQFVYKKEEQK